MASPLDNSLFAYWRPIQQALPTEAREVDGFVSAFQEQFCHSLAAPRRMHEAVTGKASQHVEVSKPISTRYDNHIAIKVVLVVETRPRSLADGLFKLWKPMRQRGPHDTLKIGVINDEVIPTWLLKRRHPSRVPVPFRPESQALRIFDVRQWLDRVLALEIMLEATKRLDWNWYIEQCAYIFCPSPRSIDEMARFKKLTRSELCGRDAFALPNKPDNLVRQKLHAH